MKYDKLIKLTRWHLICMGMWNLKKTDSSWKKMYRLYNGYKIAVPIYICLLVISFGVDTGRQIKDKEPTIVVCFNMALLISNMDVASKILIFYKHKIPDWLYLVRDMEENIWTFGNQKMKIYYKKQVKLCRIYGVISTIIAFSSISIFIGSKVQQLIRSEIKAEDVLYPIWLPFDKSKHIVGVWALEIFMSYYNVCLFSTVKLTIVTLITFLYTHLRILQMYIEDIGDKSSNDITKFIRHHQYLINLEKKVNEIIKFILFQEYFLNSANIGASLFQMLVGNSFMETLYMVVYCFYATFQIFALGWVANEVKEQSLGISDAISKSCFYNCNISTQKFLIIMMMRAQKPLMLTLGPFGPMTISTAISVVKAAYSYATLALNTYKRD